jgi:hypothetical protein
MRHDHLRWFGPSALHFEDIIRLDITICGWFVCLTPSGLLFSLGCRLLCPVSNQWSHRHTTTVYIPVLLFAVIEAKQMEPAAWYNIYFSNSWSTGDASGFLIFSAMRHYWWDGLLKSKILLSICNFLANYERLSISTAYILYMVGFNVLQVYYTADVLLLSAH